ncbi:AbrB/MazE/SpoVT family DNA-binding domain-containing protein [Candidatus Woesearchaeota archaeon]|nr:AbrB/MazE/SpoVT family DNA-binding domain-containing protein [Candidatus Woesearchaeota archaeon]MBI2661397.1 AbrB/MazE/SpoVT family DNA-binding domain-containing protein [Candidatus Woesearchaeota archaeon]
MILIKQKGRDYGNKEYFKYIVVIPNRIIRGVGWKGGEELDVELKGDKLIIEKVN